MLTEYPTLKTDRLLLRELLDSDSTDLYEIFSSEKVTKYYGMFPVTSIEAIMHMINNFSVGFKDHRSIRWGIVEKTSGKVIGTCGFHNINKHHFRAEIGYELSESYWNNGYMKETLQTILSFGFKVMNYKRIEALIYPDNSFSIKALEKLGFKKEGLLRDYMCFRNKTTDLFIYSLLEREFTDYK
ncbi:MAG: GNAT family protein [Acidaminobacteraceae bacterium]